MYMYTHKYTDELDVACTHTHTHTHTQLMCIHVCGESVLCVRVSVRLRVHAFITVAPTTLNLRWCAKVFCVFL